MGPSPNIVLPSLMTLCLASSLLVCDVEGEMPAVDCESEITALSSEVARGPYSCCSFVAEVDDSAKNVLGFELFCTNNSKGMDSSNVVYGVLGGQALDSDVVLSPGITIASFEDGFEVRQNSGAVILAARNNATTPSLEFPSQWRDGQELFAGQCSDESEQDEPLVVDVETGVVNSEGDGQAVWSLIHNSIAPQALLAGSEAYLSTPTVLRWDDGSGKTRSFVVINAGFESCVMAAPTPPAGS